MPRFQHRGEPARVALGWRVVVATPPGFALLANAPGSDEAHSLRWAPPPPHIFVIGSASASIATDSAKRLQAMDYPQFEWDSRKNTINKAKHRIGFETAALVFADPFNITVADEPHSALEQRWVTIGMVDWRILVVVHTYPERSEGEPIRIISARLATSAEIRYYEGDEHGRGR